MDSEQSATSLPLPRPRSRVPPPKPVRSDSLTGHSDAPTTGVSTASSENTETPPPPPPPPPATAEDDATTAAEKLREQDEKEFEALVQTKGLLGALGFQEETEDDAFKTPIDDLPPPPSPSVLQATDGTPLKADALPPREAAVEAPKPVPTKAAPAPPVRTPGSETEAALKSPRKPLLQPKKRPPAPAAPSKRPVLVPQKGGKDGVTKISSSESVGPVRHGNNGPGRKAPPKPRPLAKRPVSIAAIPHRGPPATRPSTLPVSSPAKARSPTSSTSSSSSASPTPSEGADEEADPPAIGSSTSILSKCSKPPSARGSSTHLRFSTDSPAVAETYSRDTYRRGMSFSGKDMAEELFHGELTRASEAACASVGDKYDILTINLTLAPGQDIGIDVSPCPLDKDVVDTKHLDDFEPADNEEFVSVAVSKIIEGSGVHANGNVCLGDRIVELDADHIFVTTLARLDTLLDQCRGPVRMVLARARGRSGGCTSGPPATQTGTASKAKNDEKGKQINDLEAEVARLKASLAAKAEASTALAAEVATLKSANEALRKENKAAHATISALEGRVKAFEEEEKRKKKEKSSSVVEASDKSHVPVARPKPKPVVAKKVPVTKPAKPSPPAKSELPTPVPKGPSSPTTATPSGLVSGAKKKPAGVTGAGFLAALVPTKHATDDAAMAKPSKPAQTAVAGAGKDDFGVLRTATLDVSVLRERAMSTTRAAVKRRRPTRKARAGTLSSGLARSTTVTTATTEARKGPVNDEGSSGKKDIGAVIAALRKESQGDSSGPVKTPKPKPKPTPLPRPKESVVDAVSALRPSVSARKSSLATSSEPSLDSSKGLTSDDDKDDDKDGDGDGDEDKPSPLKVKKRSKGFGFRSIKNRLSKRTSKAEIAELDSMLEGTAGPKQPAGDAMSEVDQVLAKPVITWTNAEVITWLCSLQNGDLAKYSPIFRQQGIDGVELRVVGTMDKLKALGVSSLGHRTLLKKLIKELTKK